MKSLAAATRESLPTAVKAGADKNKHFLKIKNKKNVLSFEFVFYILLFSHLTVSNSLYLHGLQHARLPCPSLSPRVCSNSRPLSQRCHSSTSSSADPFSFCLQSFPASGSFPVSQIFSSGSQSIEASASASVFPMNFQG